MVGWLTWSGERRVRAREEGLLGLPVLRVGLWGEERGLEKRMGRCARLLERSGVRRVLTPPGFPGWPALAGRGLSPVETAPLCRALAARLVSAQLARRDVPPSRAVAALAGDGVSPAMIRAAEELCARVRTPDHRRPGRRGAGPLPALGVRPARAGAGQPGASPGHRLLSPGPWGQGEDGAAPVGGAARPGRAGPGTSRRPPPGRSPPPWPPCCGRRAAWRRRKLKICTSPSPCKFT